jgi:Lsr2
MAARRIITKEDDLDGTPAEETVTFSLDGVSYEIDLSTSNAAGLRDAFRKYIAAANKAPHGRSNTGTGRRNRARVSAATIRTWAKAHGVTIADHGTIPEQIRRRYEQEH